VTLNFSMETRHLANVEKVEALLEQMERRDVSPRKVPAEA